MTDINPEDYYGILDALRESGAMNTFGAPKWLRDEFDLSKEDSMKVFNAWKDSFSERHPN